MYCKSKWSRVVFKENYGDSERLVYPERKKVVLTRNKSGIKKKRFCIVSERKRNVNKWNERWPQLFFSLMIYKERCNIRNGIKTAITLKDILS